MGQRGRSERRHRLISCSDTTHHFGGLIAIENLLNASSTPPAIISMSYGECEALSGATLNARSTPPSSRPLPKASRFSFLPATKARPVATAMQPRPLTASASPVGAKPSTTSPSAAPISATPTPETNSTYWNSTNTSTFGSAMSYVPEIPWNDSCASVLLATFRTGSTATYGSSGFCNTATGEDFLDDAGRQRRSQRCATGKPTTRASSAAPAKATPSPRGRPVLGIPNDGVRDIPDVSLFAANGLWGHYYVFCDSDTANGGSPCTGAPDTWSGAGGTSFSSPIMAGIQALVNQKNGSQSG